jgi:hypothetical protein
MIKLKEGQKVIDIHGNTYLIEKGDILIEQDKKSAVKEDKNSKGQIEVYYDEEDSCVYGVNSGFCYASPSSYKKWLKDNPSFYNDETYY